MVPLWPRAGVAARLVLLRGSRVGVDRSVCCRACVLHGADGGFTSEAQSILRDGAALAL
jgi:tRNA1(Val) A37 N6-methylase TrmN6